MVSLFRTRWHEYLPLVTFVGIWPLADTLTASLCRPRTPHRTNSRTIVARHEAVFGLDVIGDYLTEINVTSPTGLRQLNRAFNLDIGADFIATGALIMPYLVRCTVAAKQAAAEDLQRQLDALHDDGTTHHVLWDQHGITVRPTTHLI